MFAAEKGRLVTAMTDRRCGWVRCFEQLTDDLDLPTVMSRATDNFLLPDVSTNSHAGRTTYGLKAVTTGHGTSAFRPSQKYRERHGNRHIEVVEDF